MQIEFSREQYRSLMKAVEIGDAVYGILGDLVDKKYKKDSNKIQELQTYLLSKAADFRSKDLMEIFNGHVITSDKFGGQMEDVLYDYDNDVFWDELERRLGKRDFYRNITAEEKVESEKTEWLPERVHEFYEQWRKEFEDFGVNRLEVNKDF